MTEQNETNQPAKPASFAKQYLEQLAAKDAPPQEAETVADAEKNDAIPAENAEVEQESAQKEPEAQADADAEAAGAEKAPDEAQKEREKRKNSVQERINKALEQRRLAREAADAEKAARELAESRVKELESRLKALEAGEKPLTEGKKEHKQLAEGEPDPDKFEFGTFDPAYQRAVREYDANKILASIRAQQDQDAAQKAASAAQERWQQHLKAGSDRYDDFEEKVLLGAAEGTWAFPDDVAQMVAEADNAADVVYYLASNPDEAARLAAASVAEKARMIGRLEAKLSAPAAAPKEKPAASKAPQPLRQPRGNGGKFEKAPEELDFSEFYAKYGARKRK